MLQTITIYHILYIDVDSYDKRIGPGQNHCPITIITRFPIYININEYISSLKQSLDEDESGQILLFHPRFS